MKKSPEARYWTDWRLMRWHYSLTAALGLMLDRARGVTQNMGCFLVCEAQTMKDEHSSLSGGKVENMVFSDLPNPTRDRFPTCLAFRGHADLSRQYQTPGSIADVHPDSHP